MPYGACQRCGWQYDLSQLRKEWTSLKVCPSCFDPRPAQLSPPSIRPEGVPLINAAPEPTTSIRLVATVNFNTANQTTSASGEVTLSLSGLALAERDTLIATVNDLDSFNLRVYTVTPDNTDTEIAVTGCGESVPYCARILQYRGVDPINPIDVTTTTDTGDSGDDADPPAITPESPGAKIVAIYSALRWGGDTPWTAPTDVSNFSETYTNSTSGLPEPVIATADHTWANGEFDPDPVTGGEDETGWVAATLALKPAG